MLPQFAAQAGGSLGAAALQASTFASGLSGIGAAAGPAGLAVTAVATAVFALGAAAASTVRAYAPLQDAIQNAKATLGLYGEAGRAAGKQLQALAQDPALAKLGFDSVQAAKAIEELGSRGLETSEILGGGLKTAATLAAASGVKDLSVSAEVLVGTMRAFGIEGAEAAKVPDLLANAANVSALKLDDFRLAIAMGGSAARTANVDLKSFTAVMSLMRDRLIGASDAGTSFKVFTQALTPNSKEAAREMAKIGFNAFDAAGKMKGLRQITAELEQGLTGYTDKQRLATLELIFGSDGVRTATTLLDAYNTTNAQGVRLLDQRTAALDKQGTSDLAAKERTSSLVAAQIELNNKILLLKQRIGETLAPAVEGLIKVFGRFLDDVLEPVVTKLEAFMKLVGSAKTPQELKIALKITPGDDFTTKVLKFLSGGSQELGSLTTPGKGAVGSVLNTFMYGPLGALLKYGSGTAKGVMNALTEGQRRGAAAELRTNLIDSNLIRPLDGPDGAYRQVTAILGNFDHYMRLWQNNLQGGADAVKASLATNLLDPKGAQQAGSLWTSAMIGSLKDVFVSDPKVDSDCAVIASAILKTLGVKIQGAANAGTLAKQVAAVSTRVSQAEAQPGDFVDFSGKGYGAVSGHHSALVVGRDSEGRLLIIQNPGGSRGKDVPTTVSPFEVLPGGTATFYRPNVSPYAVGGTGAPAAPVVNPFTGKVTTPAATPPAPRGPASSAALKAEAARLLKAEKDALKSEDVDRIVQVQNLLEAFGKASPRAAAALDLVRSKLGETKKATSQFGQGFDRLSQQLEDAENSFKLDDSATAYIKSLQGISAAALKAATAEKNAYGETEKYQALRKLGADVASKARQQQEGLDRDAEQTQKERERKEKEAEEKRRQKEADAKAKREQAAQQLLELNRLVGEGRVKDAERVLGQLKATQQEELDLAGSNASERLAIVQETGPAILEVERRLALRARSLAVKDAQVWADSEKEKAKAALSGQALRAREQLIEQQRVAMVGDAYEDARLTIEGAERAQTKAVRTETAARAEALSGLKAQYESTLDAFAQRLGEGTFTDAELTAYWRDLNGLLRDATAAGLQLDPALVALRNRSRALAQEAPGVRAWAQAFQEAQTADAAQYSNTDAVMDYSLRASYGVGESGYQAALAGFGVRSLEQLEAYNRTAAESMRRVYGDVLAQMEEDMAAAAERAVALLDYYRAEAERVADEVATQADLALGRKNQADGTRVQGLAQSGPRTLLNFLGGQGNAFFGDRYWTELGEQGRADFMAALDRFAPEDFSSLGVSFLRGIRNQIGDSPEWTALVEKLSGGIEVAQQKAGTAEGMTDLGKVFAQFQGLDSRAAGYAETLRTQLLPELERIRDSSSDESVKDMAGKAIDALTGEVDAARQLADLAFDTRLSALDTQRSLGTLSERAYLQQRQVILIEQETARYRLDTQDKTGKALELAEAQHQQRLGQILAGGLISSADLTRTAQEELKRAQGELNQVLGLSEPAYQSQVRSLEELKKKYPELTAEIDRLISRYRELQKLDPLTQGLKTASQVLGKNTPLQAGLSAVTDGLAAFFGAGGKSGGKEAVLKGAASLVGGLMDVFKTGDEDTDRVVGTFVSGLQGTLMQLAQGNWVGAIVAGVATVVSTIVDIFVGGANSARKAREQIGEATKGIKFFDTSSYAKVESRGGFWGFLGFKKSTIDQEALDIARTLGDALYEAVSGGMLEGIKAGKANFSDLGIDMRKALSQNILQGLIDGFLQGEVMKNIVQPFLDKFIAAKKTADPADDIRAAQELQQAIISGNTALADFYQTVLVPTSQQLGVFGEDGAGTPLGRTASEELGLPASVQVRLNTDLAKQQQASQQTLESARIIERAAQVFERATQNGLSADVRITQPVPEIRVRARSGALLNG
nr:phage tail tape measure protein [Deinococcus betulae]